MCVYSLILFLFSLLSSPIFVDAAVVVAAATDTAVIVCICCCSGCFFCQIIVIECYSLNYSYKIQYRALLSHRDILKNNILNAFSFQTKNKLNQNKERRTKTKPFFKCICALEKIHKQYWNVVFSHFARKPSRDFLANVYEFVRVCVMVLRCCFAFFILFFLLCLSLLFVSLSRSFQFSLVFRNRK